MARKKSKSDGYDIVAGIIVYGLAVAAIICGVFLLWWGENQTSSYDSLGSEALQSAIEMTDIFKADPAFEGKLIHATGKAECQAPLEDSLFGISLKAFTLSRDVQFYQLVEHKEKKKDSEGRIEVTYDYKERWVRTPVNFNGFYKAYYRNKAKFPIIALKNLQQVAAPVTFGVYRLPQFLVTSVHNSQPVQLSLSEEKKRALLERLHITDDLLHETDGGLYIGRNPKIPHLGDVRISFSAVPLSDVSILAQVKGDTFTRYHNPKNPENVNIGQIMPGTVSLQDMVGQVDSDVTWGAWLVRGLSVLLAGIGMIFLPWDSLMKLSPVRLLVNGSTSRDTNWEISAVARLCLASLLLVAGITWLSNGSAAVGGTLVACAVVLMFLRCILPGKKKVRQQPKTY